MGFQKSSWNISMSHLVILAALVFEISCKKQTNIGENPTPTTAIGQGNKGNHMYASLITGCKYTVSGFCLSVYLYFLSNIWPLTFIFNIQVGVDLGVSGIGSQCHHTECSISSIYMYNISRSLTGRIWTLQT